MPTPTDLVTDLPADFEVFGQAVDTQMKTNADAATQKATLTTKGDIYAATGTSTPARLAVGANDTVLTADSTTATGLKWAAAGGGGMTVLASGNLSGINTLTLNSISQSYNSLQLVLRNVSTAANAYPQMRLNNVSSGLYTYNVASNGSYGNQVSLTEVRLADVNLNTSVTANNFVINVYDYKNTGSVLLDASGCFIATSNTVYAYNVWGGFENSAAISRIDIINTGAQNWDAGSYILYGVK
jgi:hypothetical protein